MIPNSILTLNHHQDFESNHLTYLAEILNPILVSLASFRWRSIFDSSFDA